MRLKFALAALFAMNAAAAGSLVQGGTVRQVRLVNGDFQLTVEGANFCSSACLNANDNMCYVKFNRKDGTIELDDYKVFVSMTLAAFASGATLGDGEGNDASCGLTYIYFSK